ncbi:hypothetical protein F3J37_01670 [Pantoea sp. Al-1710]|uniref:Type III effector n=1 Tax=Candidatus Pantoea communis TaxID=2608354 RepID=A0ABX0RKR3_9GAMM|nr:MULTISPECIES: XopG/HopH/AvrPtoH family type III secretion system effector [Pantoea]NIG12912.1 hypothetical protein [Pantoea sp. Cy-640]NIG17387.1 hypothetical protein [Pantoea communis]
MPVVRSHTAPFINIKYQTKSDLIKAESALSKLDQGPTGNRLIYELSKLSKNGKSLTIVADRKTTSGAMPTLTKSQVQRFGVSEDEYNIEHNDRANKLAQKRRFGFKGKGTSAIVRWNPSLSVHVSDEGIHSAVNDEKEAFISLAHELIHGYRMMKGTYTADHSDRYEPGTRSYKEEQRAVGLGIHSNRSFSENSIRNESKMNLRAKYVIDENLSYIG